MPKLERAAWRKVDTLNYFVTTRKIKTHKVSQRKKKNLSNLITTMSPYNKKGRKVMANISIIHRDAIDLGLQR